MCILELSEVLMFEFHYDYIKNKYGNNSRLLFAGTDSLICEIKTEDVYKDLSNDKEIFDFSNYSTSQNTMMIQTNHFLVKMKDKVDGVATYTRLNECGILENSGMLILIPDCYKDKKCVLMLLIIMLMH